MLNQVCTRDGMCIRENDNKPDIVGEYLEGYAVKWNSPSKMIHEYGQTFKEVILPDTFGDLTKHNVRFNYRHDDNAEYGDTASGTLTLHPDADGLRFKLALPKYAHSLRAQVAQGIARGMSVGFRPRRVAFVNGVRHVLSADLDHVALAFNPLHLDTSVALTKQTPLSLLKKRQDLLEK